MHNRLTTLFLYNTYGATILTSDLRLIFPRFCSSKRFCKSLELALEISLNSGWQIYLSHLSTVHFRKKNSTLKNNPQVTWSKCHRVFFLRLGKRSTVHVKQQYHWFYLHVELLPSFHPYPPPPQLITIIEKKHYSYATQTQKSMLKVQFQVNLKVTLPSWFKQALFNQKISHVINSM